MSIRIEHDAGVMTMSMARADKKNAINREMYIALADALAEGDRNPSVRSILIRGDGGNFTAGNDLEDFATSPESGEESPAFRFIRQIMRVEKPIVAEVTGWAVGIGVTMLLHCDLVYSASTAMFALPFARLGLCPEAASSLLLPRLAGYQGAAEKLLLGETFDAAEAHRMRIVNRIVVREDVETVARGQALKLASLPASSLRVTKALLKKETLALAEARFVEEGQQFSAMLRSPEAREAFEAFSHKRAPNFLQFA